MTSVSNKIISGSTCPGPNGSEDIQPPVEASVQANNSNMQATNTLSDTNAGSSPSKKSTVRGLPSACLFVASLAAIRTDEQLKESVTQHFSKWGTLLDVKVFRDSQQRPYSFVQFENEKDAQRALKEAQGNILDNRPVRIELARVNRSLLLSRRDMKELDVERVRQLAEAHGPLEQLDILPLSASQQERGLAFIKFAYREDAIQAYLSIRTNTEWCIDWANHVERLLQPSDKTSLFVGQLNAQEITESLLRTRFERYGQLEECSLINNRTSGPHVRFAYAFIRYADPDAATKALAAEHGAYWLGYHICVQYREPRCFMPYKHSPLRLPQPPHYIGQYRSTAGRYMPNQYYYPSYVFPTAINKTRSLTTNTNATSNDGGSTHKSTSVHTIAAPATVTPSASPVMSYPANMPAPGMVNTPMYVSPHYYYPYMQNISGTYPMTAYMSPVSPSISADSPPMYMYHIPSTMTTPAPYATMPQATHVPSSGTSTPALSSPLISPTSTMYVSYPTAVTTTKLITPERAHTHSGYHPPTPQSADSHHTSTPSSSPETTTESPTIHQTTRSKENKPLGTKIDSCCQQMTLIQLDLNDSSSDDASSTSDEEITAESPLPSP